LDEVGWILLRFARPSDRQNPSDPPFGSIYHSPLDETQQSTVRTRHGNSYLRGHDDNPGRLVDTTTLHSRAVDRDTRRDFLGSLEYQRGDRMMMMQRR